MRELTVSEKAEHDRRLAQFNLFLEERMPVLTDFVGRLTLPDPPMVLIDADSFLVGISEFMEGQKATAEARTWILTRIGYFIGEWLIQKYGGCWFLNAIPDTRYFLRYVVGQFSRLPNQSAMIDPFHVAEAFLDCPCPRSLASMLANIEAELTVKAKEG